MDVEGGIVRAGPGLELEGAGVELAAVEPLIGAPGRRPIGIVNGFPYPDLRVSLRLGRAVEVGPIIDVARSAIDLVERVDDQGRELAGQPHPTDRSKIDPADRKSTRLNSSH